MAALRDASTGIGGDADDLTDTTPQYDSNDSMTDAWSFSSYSSFLWTTFAFLYQGVQPSEGSGSRETWGVLG